ncbi:unnamed protein product, partial [marine sediment metagenome]
GREVEERLGVTVLGEAIYGDENEEREKSEGKCMICSKKAKGVYIARAY